MGISVNIYKANKKEWSEFAKTTENVKGESVLIYDLYNRDKETRWHAIGEAPNCPEITWLGYFNGRRRREFLEIESPELCVTPFDWHVIEKIQEGLDNDDEDFDNWCLAVLNTLKKEETLLISID